MATDIAARGIDIDQLPHVVNFELPNVAEDYVHRIGRTGRAGNEGEAMSLVCVDELKLLKDIEKLIKNEIPKNIIEGFTPDPSIKAEPIRNGRGRQTPSRKKPRNNNNDGSSPWKKRPKNKKRSNNSSGNQNRNQRNAA